MRKLLALSLILTMLLTGCTAGWLNTFGGYLKIAGPIMIQILDIIAIAKHQAPPAQLIAKIQADDAAVNTLANSVAAATAQNVQGTCAQFNLAIQTFVGDLQAIEQVSQISDPVTQNEVNAAISIAQQTIAEIEAPIAACQSAPTTAQAYGALRAGAAAVKSPEDVVKRFNAVVDAKHRVHLHGRFARTISFGVMK